jgi:hypothetical protein
MSAELREAGDGEAGPTLAFFRDHRGRLGRIVSAAVTFPGLLGDDPYTIVLRDDHGTRLLLSGAGTGYVGGSQRIVLQILVEAGFASEVAEAVRTHDFVRLSRSADGTTLLEQATATAAPIASPNRLRPDRALRPASSVEPRQGRTR